MCPVMELHALWNYEQCDGDNEEQGTPKQQVGEVKAVALDALIMRDYETLSIVRSNTCRMFHPLTSNSEKELREARRQAARDRAYLEQGKPMLVRGSTFRIP